MECVSISTDLILVSISSNIGPSALGGRGVSGTHYQTPLLIVGATNAPSPELECGYLLKYLLMVSKCALLY